MRSTPTRSSPSTYHAAADVLADIAAGERALSLAKAGLLCVLQRDGHAADISTLHRWCTRGIRGIKLPSACIGGVRVVTESQAIKWVHLLSGHGSPPPASPRHQAKMLASLEREGL